MAKKAIAGSDGTSLNESFFKGVGGTLRILKRQAWSTPTALTRGGESQVYDFGWIPPEVRTEEHKIQGMKIAASMPRFFIPGIPNRTVYDAEKVDLTKTWSHKDVVAANGSAFTGTHQLTGSCVGAGGGNMWATLLFGDAILRGEREIPKVPFWLLPYGRSRYYCGMKTPGEGSSGDCFAQAATEDGDVEFDRPALPQPTSRADGWIWGSAVEMKWSDGDAPDSMKLLPESKKFIIRTVAKCKDSTDVWDSISNGYPCTAASMYAHDGGKVQGTPACLLARKSGSWSHQMSILARWLHPQFGRIFWLMNQWGLHAHGTCPSGMVLGGVWITAADVDWICRDEVYAFSGANGFPAPKKPIDWIWL